MVDKHTTYLRIEKKTGVAIDVAKRIQGWVVTESLLLNSVKFSLSLKYSIHVEAEFVQ